MYVSDARTPMPSLYTKALPCLSDTMISTKLNRLSLIMYNYPNRLNKATYSGIGWLPYHCWYSVCAGFKDVVTILFRR